MDNENVDDEIEIKIEYNDYYEKDPLTIREINGNLFHDNVEINKDGDKQIYQDESESEARWYELIDNDGRFLCKFCKLKYSTLQTLRYHVKNKHTDKVNQIKASYVNEKRNRKLKCHICKRHFKGMSSLRTHFNSHSMEDIQTSCLYCDATFRTENEMSDHLYVQHKKVIKKSMYSCSICGYRTSIKSHYNQHVKTHSGNKINKCDYCSYSTNYPPNLKIHVRIHTNEKLYVCDYVNCEYRCSAKTALRSHQLKHYPEQNTLYCDKCSYKTIYRQSLKRHSDCHRRNSIRLKL